MKGIGSLFGTTKRAVITIVCIVVVLLIAAALIAMAVIKSGFISEQEAQQAALADAGLTESQVSGLRARLEHDDGRFCYDVDFYCDGVEYEYGILAENGEIISRDIDGAVQAAPQTNDTSAAASSSESESTSAGETSQAATTTTTAVSEDSSSQAQQTIAADGIITEDKARSTALADAGLAESDVTFTKVILETDDGVRIYDVEFYTREAEYEYEIFAADGRIKESSVDRFELSEGGASGEYIGVDAAKEIALNHAGLAEGDVTFTKAKLENDDGVAEYEISFYAGGVEYEFSINAATGSIIDYDRERG